MLELLSSVYLTLGYVLASRTTDLGATCVCQQISTTWGITRHVDVLFLLSRWNTRFAALCPKVRPRRKTQTCAKLLSQTHKSVCDVKKRHSQIFDELIKRFDLIAVISYCCRFFLKFFLVSDDKKTTKKFVNGGHQAVTADMPQWHWQLPAWTLVRKQQEFLFQIDRRNTHVISISVLLI